MQPRRERVTPMVDHASVPRSEQPHGWSRLYVVLHWLVVLLVIAQFLDHEAMVALWDATLEGRGVPAATSTGGWIHIIAGTAILAATAIRLLDRSVNGRPPYPQGEPTWAGWLARITHFLLYGVLLLMPALGLAAWLTGDDAIAGYHTVLWTPLLVLVGLHVLGALVQHFVFRSEVLKRMLSLQGTARQAP